MESGDKQTSEQREVWLLVDHSSREASLIPVAEELEQQGVSVELVTITEVIGNVAREALAGGAERLLRGLRVATKGRSGDEDLIGAIRRRQPDVLVVTEARYARAIGVLENLTGVDSLQVGLVPDFHIEPGWFNGQLHAFVVPDQRSRDELLERGIDSERIKIGGPALRPGFDEFIDRFETRQELGFGDEERVVLVRADGFDTATLEKLVFQCHLSDREARYIFHHDGDGAVASTLRRAADQYGLSAAMFGRVSDLGRYFQAVDGVLAADTDPYLAELLTAGTPLMMVPRATSDGANGQKLADDGLVDYLDDLGQLGTRLDEFLDGEGLEEYRATLGDWDGAGRHRALIEALEDIAVHSEDWRYPARPQTTPTPEQDDNDSGAENDEGPFESIGDGPSAADDKSTTGKKSPTTEAPRDFSSISRAEAKEQLAELILKERECERRLKEIEKQQERWRGRLELARDWNEDDLADEAKSILRGYLDEAEPVEEKLKTIRRQKQKLKKAARGGDAAGDDDIASGEFEDRVGQMEERFRKMEVDSDLEGLKDRIRRELGE